MAELSTVQAVAVALAGKKLDKAKKDLAPGTHKVRVAVEVEATINKGEDYTQAFPATLKPWRAVAFLLDMIAKGEATGPVAVADVTRAMLTPGETEARAKAVEAQAKAAALILAGSTERECAGKVTVPSLTISLVEATEAVPA
jgi:hypothetical protein